MIAHTLMGGEWQRHSYVEGLGGWGDLTAMERRSKGDCAAMKDIDPKP